MLEIRWEVGANPEAPNVPTQDRASGMGVAKGKCAEILAGAETVGKEGDVGKWGDPHLHHLWSPTLPLSIPIFTFGPDIAPPLTPHATSTLPSFSYLILVRSDTHLGPNTTPLATLLLLLLLLLLTTPPPFHHSPTLLLSTPILTFGPDTFPLLHSSPLSSLLSPSSDPLLPTLRQVTTFRRCPLPCTQTPLVPSLQDSVIVPTSDFDSTSA
ncbi:uncharacterized protein EI90DRAFT_3127015 [Cantharellus anzutake]|uniref:uncharacterized protein n=1 Tax=Cantharellus anzutake TaxID=1750568 RepID=UPI00190774AA|nr:uncharacterized protein EI90DRAFT_3127015 [Cantharellus anzutake]KAF8327373.1 hypothetical protein EI90DRAFT_3127015 [Cantharellus anzutake]